MSLHAVRYLHIPREYADAIGGLRWSATGDVLETGDGTTFAFAPQVADFLEGLAASRPLPHFVHVLHLMYLLGVGPAPVPSAELVEVRRAFQAEPRALRNAGALAAELCPVVPSAAQQPLVADLRRELCRSRHTFGLFLAFEPEVQALTPEQFHAVVVAELKRFSAAALRHWLKHGCAPLTDADERIAAEMGKRPPNLLDALTDAARDRERLAGAMALVPTLAGALTLPPRRLDAGALPLGGYADVTTRGVPERLLPSQFALEGLEFVRRFAEKELLYFRREEPHNPVREELVVLLDQGVRTWGGVRLALAGGLFALARLADRRRLAFFAATTGTNGYSFDPRLSDPAILGARLEASDLSPHPGTALGTLLGEVGGPRDVVLLTHPRTLHQPEVVAAWQHARPGDRAFAVAVDADGTGQLCEIRDGRPLPLTQFRVDLTPAARPRVAPKTQPGAGWTGDVEPVPFPFWFGPTVKITHMALDADGEWLLVAAKDGALHAVKLDGTTREVWPRGVFGGRVMRGPLTLLGVTRGFVVVGGSPPSLKNATFQIVNNTPGVTLDSGASWDVAVVFHYDLASRRVRTYELEEVGAQVPCCGYFPELHSVAVQCSKRIVAVDLATGGVHPPRTPHQALISRAIAACDRAKSLRKTPPRVPWSPGSTLAGVGEIPHVHFRLIDGKMSVAGTASAWEPAVPLSDGFPLFAGASIVDVQLEAETLAVSFRPRNQRQKMVAVFRGPDARLQYVTNVFVDDPDMHVGANGGLVTVHSNHLEIKVLETLPGRPPVAFVNPGPQRSVRDLMIGIGWLAFSVAKWTYVFQWNAEQLSCIFQRKAAPDWVAQRLGPDWYAMRAAAVPGGTIRLATADAARFPSVAGHNLLAMEDAFGQVVLLTRGDEKVRAILFAGRGTAEVWLPDGTRWTSTGADPGAAARIAQALRHAERSSSQ